MNELIKNMTYIIAILGLAVEITPIKINPLSWILKWLGRHFNGEIMDKLHELENKVDNNERDRIRHEIFTFGNNLRNETREYTAEEFKHIFDIYEKYENLGGNGKAKIEMKYIEEQYLKLGGR